MAGSLGISSLVCLLNNGDDGATETSQNLLGPFWRIHSARVANGGSIVRSPTPGPVLFTTFTVVDRQRRPIEGAEVPGYAGTLGGLDPLIVDAADLTQ